MTLDVAYVAPILTVVFTSVAIMIVVFTIWIVRQK